jgi:hypothetical protein
MGIVRGDFLPGAPLVVVDETPSPSLSFRVAAGDSGSGGGATLRAAGEEAAAATAAAAAGAAALQTTENMEVTTALAEALRAARHREVGRCRLTPG